LSIKKASVVDYILADFKCQVLHIGKAKPRQPVPAPYKPVRVTEPPGKGNILFFPPQQVIYATGRLVFYPHALVRMRFIQRAALLIGQFCNPAAVTGKLPVDKFDPFSAGDSVAHFKLYPAPGIGHIAGRTGRTDIGYHSHQIMSPETGGGLIGIIRS